jgi:hypothetical protein
VSQYTLAVIFTNGQTATTTFDGYYAESCADRQFDMLIEHNSSVLFAALVDGLTPRRVYRHPEFTK